MPGPLGDAPELLAGTGPAEGRGPARPQPPPPPAPRAPPPPPPAGRGPAELLGPGRQPPPVPRPGAGRADVEVPVHPLAGAGREEPRRAVHRHALHPPRLVLVDRERGDPAAGVSGQQAGGGVDRIADERG